MRIAIAIEQFDPAVGGREAMAVGLAERLAARGHELHALALRGIPVPGVTLHSLPAPAAFATAAAALGPDLLTLDCGHFLPAATVRRLGGGVTKPFRHYNRLGRPWPLRLLAGLRDTLSPQCRAEDRREAALLRAPRTTLVALSDFVAQHVREVAPDAAARVVVIPNCVDAARFHPAHRERWRAECRRAWNLREHDVAFLFVAHNLRLKNLDLLRRVFDRLAPRHPELRLVVVGRKPPHFTRPYLIHRGDMEMTMAYCGADALLHPTWYDTFGSVVLEAMASALPVAVSAFAGASEQLTDGVDGRVLPVFPAAPALAAWTATVEEWLAAPRRAALGAAARQTAEQHGWDSYVDAFERLFANSRPEAPP